MIKKLTDPKGTEVFYQGLGPEAGPLPAFLYFSLAGDESLTLEPYNSPASLLKGAPLRVFSFTIPGHGPGFNKYHALQYWAEQIETGLLETFFENITSATNWLIKQGWIDPDRIAVGGLSRGGFVATHLAARDTRIKTLLGFAPLTKLTQLNEFTSAELYSRAKIHAEALNLDQVVDQLTHLRRIRFYIGNRDERVSTDACFHFIRKMADKGHEIRARHLDVELFITRSVGFKGHGTPPSIFEEGVDWLKMHLLGRE